LRYISDIIGDDYQNWNTDKFVIICAPTGTGKTHFIINKLLPYVRDSGKQMVFVTNRTALKKQIQNDIRQTNSTLETAITVTTYQHLAHIFFPPQKAILYENDEDPLEQLSVEDQAILDCDYLVFDEAHYFLSDMEFNESIAEATDNIMTLMNRKKRVAVFMTATIENLYLYIDAFNGNRILNNSNVNIHLHSLITIDKKAVKNRYRLNLYEIINKDELSNWDKNESLENRAKELGFLGYPQDFNGFNQVPQYPKNKDQFPMFEYPCFKAIHANCPVRGEIFPGRFEKHYNEYKDALEKVREQHCVYPDKAELQEYYDYSFISPWYYEKEQELIDHIFDTPIDEKWLIFVKSIDQGFRMLNNIRNREEGADGQWNSVFVYSKSKKNGYETNKTYKELIRESRCSKRVLIVTKVLDNGVNIKDEQLKHIAIYAKNQTDFIQMLGRKRRKVNETVNLYLQNESENAMYRDYNNSLIKNVGFIQLHEEICRTQYGREKALRRYMDYYTNSGKIKSEFAVFLSLKTNHDDYKGTESLSYKYRSMCHILKSYSVNHYFKNKILFDFYQCASWLERARRQRYESLREWCTEQCYYDVINNRMDDQDTLRNAYNQKNKQLSVQQYAWLNHQLSWIKLENTPELNPRNPDRWIGGHLSNFENLWNDLCRFISNYAPAPSDNYLESEQITAFKYLVAKVEKSLGNSVKMDMNTIKPKDIFRINEFLQKHRLNLCIADRSTKQRPKWELKRIV